MHFYIIYYTLYYKSFIYLYIFLHTMRQKLELFITNVINYYVHLTLLHFIYLFGML